MRIALLAATFLVLAGCVSSGPVFQDTRLAGQAGRRQRTGNNGRAGDS